MGDMATSRKVARAELVIFIIVEFVKVVWRLESCCKIVSSGEPRG